MARTLTGIAIRVRYELTKPITRRGLRIVAALSFLAGLLGLGWVVSLVRWYPEESAQITVAAWATVAALILTGHCLGRAGDTL